jgi:hypothetical protein
VTAIPVSARHLHAAPRLTLDPGHSHFLFVSGADWGDESPWRAAAAAALAGLLQSLILVAGGGKIAARDRCEGLRLGRPALVLAGTGGTADALAASLCSSGAAPFDLPPDLPERAEVLDLARAAQDVLPLLRRCFGGQA